MFNAKVCKVQFMCHKKIRGPRKSRFYKTVFNIAKKSRINTDMVLENEVQELYGLNIRCVLQS